MPDAQSFPRHSARTQGFTLGSPRTLTVAPSGETVLFLRSASGTDRTTALWALDLPSGTERLIADPATLGGGQAVTPEEQARRERARERAQGITGYATDREAHLAAFTLSGRLFVADINTATVRELPTVHPVADPRPSPDGRTIAYLSQGALRVIDSTGTGHRTLAEPDHAEIRWGAAEFIAAEEMQRHRGYWWSPTGTALLATRVDNTPVPHWYLADPAEPARKPTTMRYPAAGTTNADVSLYLLDLDGRKVNVAWDTTAFPYLVEAHWSGYGPPVVAVQSRDQRILQLLTIDPDTGGTTEIQRETDPHWVEIKPGWPAWTPEGQLVRISADATTDTYRLVVGDQAWTPPSLQVRAVLDVATDDILISASEDNPTEIHTYRVRPGEAERIWPEPGVDVARRAGNTVVVSTSNLDTFATTVHVLDGHEERAKIQSFADTPHVAPNIELLRLGSRELHSAVLLPTGYREEQGPLPVLVDPYGGPQAQRVLARQQGHLTSQWFADQGFAVLVTDGRGMTGRGPAWDRAVAGDLAGPPLEDQIDALHALAEQRPVLDISRVGIRGWSFGGYLAALAVLRRPDVFHAAIAGAPVCDWRLYDTHYTERYLGDPAVAGAAYDSSSLLGDASSLQRPLLIIHGTRDDNVVPAHSLRLSEALTAAAQLHSLLPLAGVSHMPTDEATTENLLLLQVDFLRRALAQPKQAEV
jgi:dipeptidyl-peptidase-4